MSNYRRTVWPHRRIRNSKELKAVQKKKDKKFKGIKGSAEEMDSFEMLLKTQPLSFMLFMIIQPIFKNTVQFIRRREIFNLSDA
jgi:hypothetical protein